VKGRPKRVDPAGTLSGEDGSLQHRQLLPEGDVLEADVGRVDAQGAKEDPDTEDEEDHHGSGRVGMTTQPKLYSERDRCRVTSVAVGPDELFDRHRRSLGPASAITCSHSVTNPYATNAPTLFDNQGNYRGKLSTNPYDPDSISNPYWRFGSRFSPDRINPQ